MKKLLIIIAALCLLFSLSVAALAAAPEDFSDFPDNWSREAMTAALENGLLQGSDGKIDPQGYLTRAQMAAIMVRAMGGRVEADISNFTDMSPDAWYYREMSIAVTMKLFQGTGGDRMDPMDNITREQAILVTSRLFKLTDADADISGYLDSGEISPWAYDGVACMVKAGYIQGSGEMLNPKGLITREEFAQMMFNMVDRYILEPGIYKDDIAGTVVIRADGVTLDNCNIGRDIIVGDGVGDGDAYINDCETGGRLLVRGGGAGTVYVIYSRPDHTIVARPDGPVWVVFLPEAGANGVSVADGMDHVILEGKMPNVSVDCPVPVTIVNAQVEDLSATASRSNLTVGSGTTVANVQVQGSAAQTTLTVSSGATVNNVQVQGDAAQTTLSVENGGAVGSVTTEAANTTVNGAGRVSQVIATENASDLHVETPFTDIDNNSSTPVQTAEGVVPPNDTNTTDSRGAAEGTGGGGASGGGEGRIITYYQLKLEIEDGAGRTVPPAVSNRYLAGSTPFYAEAVKLINASREDLRDTFGDTTAGELMQEGLDLYYDDNDAAFSDYVSENFGGVSDAFLDLDVTLSEIVGEHTMTYQDYIVTVTVTPL